MIAFVSGSDFALPLLQKLFSIQQDILLITKPDVTHRGKILTNQFTTFAKLHSLPIWQPVKPKNLTIAEIESHIPPLDLAIVASYGYILPQSFVDYPQNGCVNWHPSYLPALRGPTPVQTAIATGMTQTGLSWIQMNEKMDAGDIILQTPVDIEAMDTTEILLNKMVSLGAKQLQEVMFHITHKKNNVPQDHSQASFTKLLNKTDGVINITNNFLANELVDLVRAYTPFPRVWVPHPKLGIIRVDAYSYDTSELGFQLLCKNNTTLVITKATDSNGVALTAHKLMYVV